MFHVTQFELLPVTSEAVARETRRDPILARVYESIVKGWSVRIDGDKLYYERRNELTVHQGCILWGIRVVIPNNAIRFATDVRGVAPDTVVVGEAEVVSLPPVATQQSAPPNIVGTVPEIPVADQPEMVSVPASTTTNPPDATPASPAVRERRYPQRTRKAPQRLDL